MNAAQVVTGALLCLAVSLIVLWLAGNCEAAQLKLHERCKNLNAGRYDTSVHVVICPEPAFKVYIQNLKPNGAINILRLKQCKLEEKSGQLTHIRRDERGIWAAGSKYRRE